MLDIIFFALLIAGFCSARFFANWCEKQVNK
ncbi:hypothetical protein B0H39_004289 [Clostridium beijerinckii]|nr:hypothetical protein [Clostridium beijerinckii]NOV70070.1 hypothetical protein [Clostridium beijerinckii]NOW31023.1 hypothetical protein [Clostridium beijerinckii]NOW86408.1 hypothetical protein [Clostridium beijerinckii]